MLNTSINVGDSVLYYQDGMIKQSNVVHIDSKGFVHFRSSHMPIDEVFKDPRKFEEYLITKGII